MELKHLKSLLLLHIFTYISDMITTTYTHDAGTKECEADRNATIWMCNYIPDDIPKGYYSVYIDLSNSWYDTICNGTNFQSNNWQLVEILKITNMKNEYTDHLYFQDNCFTNLNNLQQLDINVEDYFQIFPDAFHGQNSVKLLSFSGCQRSPWNDLLLALNGTDRLSNLKELDLYKVHIISGSVHINTTVAQVLGSHNLTSLSFSGMLLSDINFTALMFSLPNLKLLNLSFSCITDTSFPVIPKSYGHIEVLDLSYMLLLKSRFPIDIIAHNITVTYNSFNKYIVLIMDIKTVNVSGMLAKTKVELYNCVLILEKPIPIKTKSLEMRDNNLIHIDIDILGNTKNMNTSIEHIDLSRNNMEFINPAVLSLVPNLRSLKMSENNLNNMLSQHTDKFENLFYTNIKLQLIDLSTNGLELLTVNQFIYNPELEEIYLSNNLLQQVHWKMDNLTKLKILDLSNNRIVILDSTSLVNVNSLISSLSSDDQLVLKIENNPLSCSQCESKQFITWLTSTSCVDLSTQKLTCSQENGKQEDVKISVVLEIESICFRQIIIKVCSVTFGSIFICAIVLFMVILHHRKLYNKQLKRNQLLANIQQGEGVYEFATMLSYNNQEEDFIRQYVLEPLNKTLQTMTGVDRELVLTGDQHFRPGFMVNNEIASSLDRVSLVLILITDEYCTCLYCLSEIDQAWMNRKPMIFMFKQDVDENLMTPIMKTICEKNVSILWTEKEGEYVLNTTWESVGTTILELIIK